MKHTIPFLVAAMAALLLLPACGDQAGGGGGTATSSIVGTWQLDVAELKKAMKGQFDKEMEGKSEQEIAMMKGMIEPMLAAFDKASFTVEMKGDGTWTGKSNFPQGPGGGMKLEEARGTYTLDGDQLTVVTTHEDEKKKDEPDTLVGTWTGDEIRVTEKDGSMNFQMVMRRK